MLPKASICREARCGASLYGARSASRASDRRQSSTRPRGASQHVCLSSSGPRRVCRAIESLCSLHLGLQCPPPIDAPLLCPWRKGYLDVPGIRIVDGRLVVNGERKLRTSGPRTPAVGAILAHCFAPAGLSHRSGRGHSTRARTARGAIGVRVFAPLLRMPCGSMIHLLSWHRRG